MKDYCRRGHRRDKENIYSSGHCKSCSCITSKNRYYRTRISERGRRLKNITLWHQKHPHQRREAMWKRSKIRITIKQYNKMLVKQNHTCAVCGLPERVKNKSLAVDHNHITNQIRGLVCQACNTKIIWAVENHSDLIKKAKEYLKHYENV